MAQLKTFTIQCRKIDHGKDFKPPVESSPTGQRRKRFLGFGIEKIEEMQEKNGERFLKSEVVTVQFPKKQATMSRRVAVETILKKEFPNMKPADFDYNVKMLTLKNRLIIGTVEYYNPSFSGEL